MVEKTNASYLYILFVLCFIGGVLGGAASTMMPSYLPDVIKEFQQDNIDSLDAIINSVFIFGMLFGGLSLGFFSDRLGRKKGVEVSIAFICLFMLFSSFADAWELIILSRFLTGVGVGGVLLTTTILIAEEWSDKNRSIALGILSISFPVGIFSAGIITYFISDWRNAFLFGFVPLLLVVIIHFVVKESSKWQSNKLQQSLESKTPFAKAYVYDLATGSLIYGTMLIGLWAVFAWLPTWVQSVVVTDGQKERGVSMMLFAIGGLSCGIISGWLSNRFGMKTVMLFCFAGAFVLSVILFKFTTALSLLSYFGMASIALFFGISQGVLNVYIPELFPTNIRSSATGFCFNISRIFSATVVFFVGWLIHVLNGYGNALFTFSFVFLIGLIVTLLSREKQLIQST